MKKLLKIKYNGSDFCGYQVQPSKRTVQGELNRACEILFGCKCNITGCSRTDSGVHALSFFATVEAADGFMNNIPSSNIPNAINNILPRDIAVITAYDVENDFHPRYDVISKEYTYLLLNEKSKDPFWENKALLVPRIITERSLSLVNEACTYLVGEHDFTSFMAQGSKITDTRRTIFDAKAEFTEDQLGNRFVSFKISGNGFLYNMVRIITGTLLDVAYEKLLPSDIQRIIEQKNRSAASGTAPACGLYLSRVVYPSDTFK